ncbi:hypothetical protein JCM6882_000074 [Rhodosporidiobolus microsporus]
MSDVFDVATMQAPQWVATALRTPAMVGYQLQLLLYGVFLQQFASYSMSGELQEHNKVNRTVLWLSLVLNSIYTGFTFAAGLNGGVNQNRTIEAFYNGPDWWAALPLLSATIAAFSQVFLTMRAAGLFSNRKAKVAFTAVMGLLIGFVMVGGCIVFADSILYSQGADDEDLTIPWNTGVAIWLWSSALADILISTALAYNLRKRIAGFNEITDSVLRKLVHIAVRTASYTSLISLAGAVTASIWSDADLRYTEINIAFWTPAAALHGIALFTFSSSGRRHIQSHLNGNSHSPSKGVGAFSPTGAGGGVRNGIALQTLPRPPMSIRVEQQTQIAFDDAEEKSEGTEFEKEGGRRFDV